MNFDINFPVRIISGAGCVPKSKDIIASLGAKKAFIVTGKSGAKKSGALDDITRVLDACGTEYRVFDKITENPLLLTCFEGGQAAIEEKADLIIGIGGGSALDAAKSVATFAANPKISPLDIYDISKCSGGALPIIAVPTTAGTGSEANCASVMTLPGGDRKKSTAHRFAFSTLSFVDPRYTYSLPYDYTVSTALDAFAHAIESYLSPKSTVFSEEMALFAAGTIHSVLRKEQNVFSEEDREQLAYASSAAGAAISVTGTGFPHPLGYSLTLFHGVPHGKACAVFDPDYLHLNGTTEAGQARLSVLYERLSTTEESLCALLLRLANVNIALTDAEIKHLVDLIKDAGNYVNSPYVLSDEEKYDIYRKHFAK